MYGEPSQESQLSILRVCLRKITDKDSIVSVAGKSIWIGPLHSQRSHYLSGVYGDRWG